MLWAVSGKPQTSMPGQTAQQCMQLLAQMVEHVPQLSNAPTGHNAPAVLNLIPCWQLTALRLNDEHVMLQAQVDRGYGVPGGIWRPPRLQRR